MVYGFTKQSQGYITVNSRPKQGASVSLLLPIGKAEEQKNEARSIKTKTCEPKASVSTTSAQIWGDKLMLLVEDDPDVRALLQEQLVTLGFTVITAIDADEAEQLIKSLKSIDGLVSDINMPGRLNGLALAELMQSRFPASTIVLITGYAYEELPDNKRQPFKILKKPFARTALEQAIFSEKLYNNTK